MRVFLGIVDGFIDVGSVTPYDVGTATGVMNSKGVVENFDVLLMLVNMLGHFGISRGWSDRYDGEGGMLNVGYMGSKGIGLNVAPPYS